MSTPELSVVVPVYNEAGNVPEFLRRVVPVLEGCVDSYEIIFAADPSSDGTEDLIAEAAAANPSVKLLCLSRRFGQPAATLAGLEHSTGQAAVVIDVDLQDPPEVIPELVDRWREGFAVVYAQRRKRDGETLVKRVVASLGYRFMNRFSEVEIPRDTGDFRLVDRRVIDELKRFPEAHGFLRGLVALVGFEQDAVTYDRPARHAGKGNYNRFLGSLRIGFNGIVAFSSALLGLSAVLGFVAAFLSLATGLGYFIAKLLGAGFPVGNPTVVCIVLLLGGLQLICLGVVGLYIGRIYDEVKQRPRYIVDQSIGFDE